MKHLVALVGLISLVVLTSSVSFAGTDDSTFITGINWFSPFVTLDHHNWHHLWEDDLKFNVMHVGNLNDCHAWVQDSGKARLIFADDLSPDRFSHSGIMIYTPLEKPMSGSNASDTLTHSYFRGLKRTYGHVDSTLATVKYWEDSALASDHTDKIILDSNEILNGDAVFRRMFRENNGTKFKLAVKMNVGNIDTTDTHNAIEVWVKLFKWNRKQHLDTCCQYADSFLVYKEFIPWKKFTTVDKDSVFFTADSNAFVFRCWDDSAGYPVHIYPINHDFKDSTDYLTEVHLEVHSQRYATTRITWVAIFDVTADSLLAGSMLDPEDSARRYMSDSIVPKIIKHHIDSVRTLLTRSGQCYLWKEYLHDEPQTSEMWNQGRVDSIINDSGEVERANFQIRRFATQAKLKTYRCGDWGTGGGSDAVSAWYDKGSGNGRIWKDSATNKSRKRWQHLSFGYFPFTNGAFMSDTAYALDTVTSITGATDVSLVDSLMLKHSERNFDIFDYGLNALGNGSFTGLMWHNGVIADSLIYLNPVSTSPKEWWPNIFLDGNLRRPVWHSLDTPSYTPYGPIVDSGGYLGAEPPIPEQLSLVSNLAILMGCKGLIFWKDRSITSDPGPDFTPGFTNFDGTHDSDAVNYFDSTYGLFPFFYNRNIAWARSFNKHLLEDLPALYRASWIGSFIRRGTAAESVDTQSIGRNPIVSPVGDSMHRRMLTRWVPDNNDSINANIKEVKLPDYMRYMAYGFFRDVSAGVETPTYLLTALSMVLDPRNLRCEFVKDADSAINHKYIMRGDRIVWSQMHLDSTVATWWRVHLVGTPSWDTVIAWNGQIKQYYHPGEMHVFSIHPTYNVHVAQGNIEYNNGRRMQFDTTTLVYHITYSRNDSVLYRQSTDSTALSWGPEYCIAAPSSPIYSCSRPSIRLLTIDGVGIDAVGITYEETDTSKYYVYLRINREGGDPAHWDSPILLRSFKKANLPFEPTPVLSPIKNATYCGFVAAWADSMGIARGIGLCAVNLNSAVAGPLMYINAVHNTGYPANILDSVSGFPTIVEDTTGYGFGLAFQQQRAGKFSQIFFTTGTVTNASTPVVIILNMNPNWVSRIYGPECDNLHPCIDLGHAMDVTTSSVMRGGGGIGGQPWTAIFPIVGNGPGGNKGIHPIPGGYTIPLWNIVWDAPVTVIMREYSEAGSSYPVTYTENAIWQAMADARSPNVWQFNLFQPPNNDTGRYYYPSIRVFNGKDSTSNLPAVIGWWTSKSTVLFARTLNVYPPAGGNPNFLVNPLQERGITETAIISPPPTTTPNLEMNSHINPWYYKQRSVYEDLRMPDIRVLVQSIPNLDTAGSWLWQGCVHYQMKDTGIVTCVQNHYTVFDPKQYAVADTVHLLPGAIRTQFMPLRLPKDSAGWNAGIFAITDTIHVDSLSKQLLFLRSCFSPDTVALGATLGSGWIQYDIEAASCATGQTLIKIDSLVIKDGNLRIHSDSIIVNLTSLIDSFIFFRVRVVDSGTPTMAGVVAKEYAYLSHTAPGGLAKTVSGDSARYAGRADMQPVGIDPLGLTASPNPFANQQVDVRYTLPVEDASDITLIKVVDVIGHDVTTLVHDVQAAGPHLVSFSGADLPAGQFIVAVMTHNHVSSRLIIRLK